MSIVYKKGAKVTILRSVIRDGELATRNWNKALVIIQQRLLQWMAEH